MAYIRRDAKIATALQNANACNAVVDFLGKQTLNCVQMLAGQIIDRKHLKIADIVESLSAQLTGYLGFSVPMRARSKHRQLAERKYLFHHKMQEGQTGKLHMPFRQELLPDLVHAKHVGQMEKLRAHTSTIRAHLMSGGCVGHVMSSGMPINQKAEAYQLRPAR